MKTHWKKVVSDPNFIGEGDFQEGEEKVLTIDRVNASETVQTAEGKSKKAVVHWKEPGNKPMILNVARSKNIEKVAGSGYFEDCTSSTELRLSERWSPLCASGPISPASSSASLSRPARTAETRSSPPWERRSSGWRPTPQRTTVSRCVRSAPRSAKMQRRQKSPKKKNPEKAR